MSNRYAHNRQDGNKGFIKTQKKFVPKAMANSVPIESQASTTLSNSLRQSFSRPPVETAIPSSGGAGDLTSSARAAEREKLVPDKVRDGNFVNYLPQDEAVAAGLGAEEGGLDPVEAQRVVDHLNRELSRLLKLSPRDFWREVASDCSLHNFLESFLQFRSRWYDFPYRGVKGIVAGIVVGEFELSRRVFMVLYRISSNRDPGARAADSLSPTDHTALLQEKKLLDLPKLLDICAIYGHENEDLTRSLVLNALKAQPMLHDSFSVALSQFMTIVHTMQERCSSSLEVLFSSHGLEDHGSHRLHTDYLEVLDFMNDAIVSMDAFVCAYKPAALYFSCPVETSYGNEELLSTLARLHDSLLPSLQRGLHTVVTAGGDGVQGTHDDARANISLSLKMLSTRIAKFGWKLLDICYLSDEVFEGNFPLPVITKMFPAKVEDPIIRTDILVQTFREISGGYPDIQEGQKRGTFLQNVEKNHRVMERVEFLQNTGWISMDEEQFNYISRILKHPSKPYSKDMSHVPTSLMGNNMQVEEDTAILESKISQIKDLFPNYGTGFLSACLEVYNHNPEEVIQRILEGSLHEDLKSLDTSLESIPPPKSAPLSRNDKGKGKLVEPTPPPSKSIVPIVRQPQTEGPSSVSALSSVGRFVRKSALTPPDSDILDSRNEKDIAITAALISELEYDDEYDDSFDDLGLSVADSGAVEETEILGDKLNMYRGKSWETGSGSSAAASASNSDKWGSRKKPQYYVKDGKHYSYKVAGSVAVANYNEATIVNQTQRELIHGLGRGGNHPLGAAKKLSELTEEQDNEADVAEAGGRGNSRGRGRRGGGGGRNYGSNEEQDNEADVGEAGGHGNFRGRGRRGGGGGRNNYRKDRAMKKHFSGVTGF